LVNQFSVSGGRLATRSGMQYRILALDPHSRSMSLPVLRKIRDLVNTGAVVVGARPTGSPSLSDDDAEFRRLADELWGTGTGGGAHRVGSGTVHGDANIESVLSELQAPPDFSYTKPTSNTQLLFVHRTLPDADFYFVNNRSDRDQDVEATFRVSGREAEIWRADTGTREPAAYRITADRTTVPLHLDPWDAVFVVFRKAAAAPSRTISVPTDRGVATVQGSWTVRFQPNRGAPETITLSSLQSWSDHSAMGVKYFSGTAVYTRTVDVPASLLSQGPRLWIDLGDVKNLAEIAVNGTPLGIVWKRPFRLDATSALKAGANTLEVKVTNLWVNRMIGDRQPNATTKYTFTAPVFYKANSPLLPSGLIGPVRIVQVVPAGTGASASR
jgi:(4-O-methyl)-D-glucuronate---lignin esterase